MHARHVFGVNTEVRTWDPLNGPTPGGRLQRVCQPLVYGLESTRCRAIVPKKITANRLIDCPR